MTRREFCGGMGVLALLGTRALRASRARPPQKMQECAYADARCPGLVYPKPPPGKIVVMQDWDDSIETDIRLMDICRKHKAKATFNLIPRDEVEMQTMIRRKPGGYYWWGKEQDANPADVVKIPSLCTRDYREAYKDFCVAGHCYFLHEEDEESLRKSRTALRDMRDFICNDMGRKAAGFAYPGGVGSIVGQRLVREAGFRYGRSITLVGDTFEPRLDGAWPLVWQNPYFLGVNCGCQIGIEPFFKAYEAVKSRGGFFWFWGHSCEFGDDRRLWDAYEEKIQRISEDRDATWIDPIELFVRG